MSKIEHITPAKGRPVHVGETVTLRFKVTDENGNPVNMTGYTVEWVLESSEQDQADQVAKDTGSGGITITDGDATNDQADVVVDAADSAALAAGLYRHALWRRSRDKVLAKGDFELLTVAKVDG